MRKFGLEKMGAEKVRLLLTTAGLPQPLIAPAIQWLAERDEAERLRNAELNEAERLRNKASQDSANKAAWIAAIAAVIAAFVAIIAAVVSVPAWRLPPHH